MALIGSVLPLFLAALFTLQIFPYAIRLIGRVSGSHIRSNTQSRRELLFSRASAEETEQKAKALETAEVQGGNLGSSSTSLDSDWEQIDDGDKTPTEEKSQGAKPDPVDADFAGVIGFLHPFCNAGGGGERVLFAAIRATQRRYPNCLCVVYTGDHEASRDQILTNVKNRFNIHLKPARLVFLYLSTREYVLASKWPRFTLLGQSLGSLALGWEALNLLPPDIFVDTMGYAFTLALCKWLFPKMPTGAYVHYPTISTDMLQSLQSEEAHGLNAGTGKGLRGWVKILYWEMFAKLYGWVGGSVDVVMTNSSWTQKHISLLWGPGRTRNHQKHDIGVVYPPCAVAELHRNILVDDESETQRSRNILYIAQFRPEKMHQTVIDAFHSFINNHHKDTPAHIRPKLVLIGSVRDDHDEKRVYKLRLQAQEVKDSVVFLVNAKWAQVLEYLKSCSVGVNAMWNEHFGIGVVEYQAAGLICVVNDSGGPKEDIVVPIDGEPTGFHASTTDEFADAFARALSLSPEAALSMRHRARKSSWRFSERTFSKAWTAQLESLVAISE